MSLLLSLLCVRCFYQYIDLLVRRSRRRRTLIIMCGPKEIGGRLIALASLRSMKWRKVPLRVSLMGCLLMDYHTKWSPALDLRALLEPVDMLRCTVTQGSFTISLEVAKFDGRCRSRCCVSLKLNIYSQSHHGSRSTYSCFPSFKSNGITTIAAFESDNVWRY